MSLIVVVEGDTDLPLARALAKDAGLEVDAEIDARGKDQIDRRLGGYVAAARGSPWLVLRDLDTDAECAPSFLRRRRVGGAPFMCFRLVVREAESWLLADSEAIAEYLALAPRLVPRDPDELPDPTRALLKIVGKSPSARRRREMLPMPEGRARVGPGYEAALIELGTTHWRLDRAVRRSDSLARARRALRAMAKRWQKQIAGA